MAKKMKRIGWIVCGKVSENKLSAFRATFNRTRSGAMGIYESYPTKQKGDYKKHRKLGFVSCVPVYVEVTDG